MPIGPGPFAPLPVCPIFSQEDGKIRKEGRSHPGIREGKWNFSTNLSSRMDASKEIPENRLTNESRIEYSLQAARCEQDSISTAQAKACTPDRFRLGGVCGLNPDFLTALETLRK